MTLQDAVACRRALRDILEIAAVAVLDSAAISDQDALQTIAPIAKWAAEDMGGASRNCGDVIQRLYALIGETDFETMDDRSAMHMFRQVTPLLQGDDVTAGPVA
ncbi:MAG: hypothetical protein EON87_08910 [Brevundimonas sp.]|nr:MAG: hypothetical protein EON87_08910 [Brevundimonas sp.]